MEFKEVSLHQATGAVLAHGLKLNKRTLKKGCVLTATDIADLEENECQSVVVALFEPDDVGENEAVMALAKAIAGDSISAEDSLMGRCNLRASEGGVLVIKQEILDNINLVHESLTVATLDRFSVVYQAQLVATVKAIPYAVSQRHLQACLNLAWQAEGIIRVAPFRSKSVGFIQTYLRGTREGVLDKTSSVLSKRLERIGSHLLQEVRCEHNLKDVSSAMAVLLEQGADMLVISGASAVADRRDIVPSAVVYWGGEIIHFGMPVDPGNLLLLARLGGKYVLGMPGCARSPKYNGFDIILERLVADIEVTSRDIMRMGVGGLLSEIGERPQPRAIRTRKKTDIRAHKVSAIILAAGQSRRMGATNKLLMELDGRPMVAHVTSALEKSCVDEIIVVTGHEGDQIKAALKAHKVRYVDNPAFDKGLSTSLASGLGVVAASSDAVMVCLGDMPLVKTEDIERLIAAFDSDAGREICVPVYRGKRGNPVLWSRRFIKEMIQMEGDVGAKHLLFKYDDVVYEVPMQDAGVLVDFDTRQAVTDYRGQQV